MQTFPIFILIISCCTLHAQSSKTKSHSVQPREFKNQGTQEDYHTSQFFEENYSKKVFDRYKGDIVSNGDGFKYADQTLIVWNTSNKLKAIFAKGLFYPSIITGTITSKPKTIEELNTMTANQTIIYHITRTDSLTIANLEELQFLSKSPTQKRFRFWLYRHGLHNPQVCFIELTNKSANKKTGTDAFINGSVLTFYKDGWIVI